MQIIEQPIDLAAQIRKRPPLCGRTLSFFSFHFDGHFGRFFSHDLAPLFFGLGEAIANHTKADIVLDPRQILASIGLMSINSFPDVTRYWGDMAQETDIREQALTAVRSEPRIGRHFKPEALAIDGEGIATIEAEVENVAIKRLVLERLAATPGIGAIVDRLRVKPAMTMSDDGILDHLRKAYYQEPAFQQLAIKEREAGQVKLMRAGLPGFRGEIEIEVEHGVVTLNGSVPSLASKRLAGVLAWWVPGSRDVINGITVDPPEEDGPIQIEEAVRIALEKDPLIDASQIRVGVRGRKVHLTGLVEREASRDAAEWDAWYVFGVDDVINDIAAGS